MGGVKFPEVEEGGQAKDGDVVQAEYEVDESPKAVEMRAIKERLKVTLTRDEREAFADELIEFLVERTQLEADLAAVKSQYKAKIDKVTASVNEITSIMQAGFQMKDVECTLEMDYAKGEVRKVRLDTGEVFWRPMEPSERQRGLDLGIEPEPQEEQA